MGENKALGIDHHMKFEVGRNSSARKRSHEMLRPVDNASGAQESSGEPSEWCVRFAHHHRSSCHIEAVFDTSVKAGRARRAFGEGRETAVASRAPVSSPVRLLKGRPASAAH
jgi:hypothetical protein